MQICTGKIDSVTKDVAYLAHGGMPSPIEYLPGSLED